MKFNYLSRLSVLLTALLYVNFTYPQIPLSYYSSLKGKKGAELKSAVHNLIYSNTTVLDYGSGSGATWQGFYSTDRMDNNKVRDRYSYQDFYFPSNYSYSAVSGMNIEHSFPKSWWGGTSNQAYKDLYNLMPCESSINSSKSNYPMGTVTNVKTTNNCTKVGTGAAGTNSGASLWEPADEWKGDFARGYMYMATCYQNLTWSGTQALTILEQDEWPTLQQWAYTLYMQWARNDKVSQIEVNRNNAVNAIQGNRNPFIDFPNLMEYIWGDSINYDFNPETTVKSSSLSDSTIIPASGNDTIFKSLFTVNDGGFTIENVTVPSSLVSIWTNSTKQYGMKGTAYNSGNNAGEGYLVSPEIDLSKYKKVSMNFNHALNYCTSPSGYLSVEVRCNGNVTVMTVPTWPSGSDWSQVNSGDIDLSAFDGSKIKIAFHYKSTSSVTPTWEILSSYVIGTSTTGIYSIKQEGKVFDTNQPYELWTANGSRLKTIPSDSHGMFIIKQSGKTWKISK